MRTLAMPTFLAYFLMVQGSLKDCYSSTEQLYFAELLQIISEWAVLDRFIQKQSSGGVL